jgi:hypothetical protein
LRPPIHPRGPFAGKEVLVSAQKSGNPHVTAHHAGNVIAEILYRGSCRR